MYGNETLPGVAVSETYRSKGSIWQGAPEATWFATVNLNGADDDALTVPAGTIMKELTDGSYAPITADDIIAATSDLPGARLAIVADKTANSSVLVGKCGKVDKAKLLVADTAFEDLTETQQINLNVQLEAWGFMLVTVLQA